jgi:hypothetical protein
MEQRYVRMKEENEFIKDKLVKLEASAALSQDNLEKNFDNLQFTLDTIFSKIALLSPGSHIDGESVSRKIPVKVGEKNLLKGLKDWKLSKHGVFADDNDEDDYDRDAARNGHGLHCTTKQKMKEQKLNNLVKDASKTLVNYHGERTPHKLHSFVTPFIDYFNICHLTENEKIQFATSRLKNAARRWWDDEKNEARKSTTFHKFRAYLESSFSSESTDSEIRSDLRNLRQNCHSIEQLEDEFTKLTVLVTLSHAEKCRLEGLTSVPATFQRMIQSVLKGGLDVFCGAYLDEIIVYSRTLKEHCEHVCWVLQQLANYQLIAKMSKCEWGKPEVQFLGFLVSKDGIRITPEHIEAIHTFPKPKPVTDIKSFLGLANYFHWFVAKLAELTGPLSQLASAEANHGKKCQKIVGWNLTHHHSFVEIKEAIVSAPVLQFFASSLPTKVNPDASQVGLRAWLAQDDGKG